MNKSAKIVLSVFIIVFSKVTLDIPLVAHFLMNIKDVDFYKLIGYTALAGLVIIFIYNKLQQLYPFIIAVAFVYYILALQPILYYGYPLILPSDFTLVAIPGYVIIGNLLLFMLLKGISIRLSDENLYATDSLINYSKYSALIVGGAAVLFLALKWGFKDMGFYQAVSLGGLLLGSFFLTGLTLNTLGGNEIIDNPQFVKAENKISKLIRNPFFIVLLITAIIGSIALTFSLKLFINTTIIKYNHIPSLVRLLGFYTLALGVLGIAFEIFLRSKIILYMGIKNSLRLFPIIIILFVTVFLLNNYIFKFSVDNNKDGFFILFIIVAFLMLIGQFAFENISMPTTHSFYLPINVGMRNDFYVKSFMVGILSGIAIVGFGIHYITKTYIINEGVVLPYVVIASVIILLLFNNKPVFRNYQLALQQYLDTQSRKIIINKGLFKDLDNNNPDDFKGPQFLRFINLLILSNPVLAKKAIKSSILSEENFTQRIALVKSERLFMLETMNDLFSIKQTKYFPSSPNRDKIENIISRFLEVTQRMSFNTYIDQLSISKENQERVFGAKLVYYTNSDDKEKIIIRLLKDHNLPVILNTITSSSGTKAKAVIKEISDQLNNPALGNAAYATLLSCGEITLPILEEAFYETGQTEKVQLRIIQLFGDIANEEATEYLIKKLNISNQNIISAALSALSKCSLALSDEKTTMLKHELEELCGVLIWNLSFSVDLKKSNCSETLLRAMQVEIETNYARIFDLLSLFYDSKSIKLIENNLFSNDFEKITFALELAGVLLKSEIKLLVLPLLQPISEEEKVRVMQDQMPTEKLFKREVLHSLIQRESKWINQWTKACAMHELSEDLKDEDISVLLANMINPDTMIAELAVQTLFRIDKNIYFENKKIFGDRFLSLFDTSVLERIEKDEKKQEFPILKFEIINYLTDIEEFSGISGEILKRLTDNILPVKIKSGEILEEIEDVDTQSYFYVLYSGSLSLLINDRFVKFFGPKTFITSLDILTEVESKISLFCEQDAIIYRISSYAFIELLTIYNDIPESIIKHTNNKKLTEYESFIKKRQKLNYSTKPIHKLTLYHQN